MVGPPSAQSGGGFFISFSLTVGYPAACREFVIPAEAGIQQGPTGFPRIQYGAGPVSSTGQACHARNDGPEQKTIPVACCGVVHLNMNITLRLIIPFLVAGYLSYRIDSWVQEAWGHRPRSAYPPFPRRDRNEWPSDAVRR